MFLAHHRERNYGAQEIKSSVEVNPPDKADEVIETPKFVEPAATEPVVADAIEDEETEEEKRKPGRPSKKKE